MTDILSELKIELEKIQRLETENANLRTQLKALESLVSENQSLRAKLQATEKLARANYTAGLSRGFCERQAADLELKQADEQIGQAVTDGLIAEGEELPKPNGEWKL